MPKSYVKKLNSNVVIHSSRHTSNVLDGAYKSAYKGKSMNFENLREYVVGDDVKDIDWKSSARSGNLLIKQFIATKKHNVLLVLDTGKKMDADTDKHENKRELALNLAGTIAYIAIKNGDYVGLSYFTNSNGVIFEPFKDSFYSLEKYLSRYENLTQADTTSDMQSKTKNKKMHFRTQVSHSEESDNASTLDAVLQYVYKNVPRRMIIFLISDLAGIDTVSQQTLKKLSHLHDILVINLNDNFMTGRELYDTESNKYISTLFLNDSKLHTIEQETRRNLLNDNLRKLGRYKASLVSVSALSEIDAKIIELLKRHQYVANLH